MKDKSNNKILGVWMIILSLLAAFGIQILVAVVGDVIFNIYMVAYDQAHGIEWYFDTATNSYVNFYTPEQYSSFLSIVTIVSELVMLLVGAIWYKKMTKIEEGVKAVIKPMVVILALVLGVGIQGITSILLQIIYNVYPDSWTAGYDALMDTMLDSSSPLMIVSVVILAPIAEELFFRGIALNYGRRFFPAGVALVAQALCFGILHMNPVQTTYATVIGIMLGLVALEFKSVWPGIIVHIGVNGSAELLSLMGLEIPVALMTIIGLVLCLLASGGHILLKKQEKNKKALDKTN